MPYIGRRSFLQETTMRDMTNMTVCQCPISGGVHFYCATMCVYNTKPPCVNALYRAAFISTFPEKFPHFDYENNVSMPYIGRRSFLPCPSGALYFSGFPRSFLRIFFVNRSKSTFFTRFLEFFKKTPLLSTKCYKIVTLSPDRNNAMEYK